MKIIIDIGHPAHVHLFRNYARNLLEGGHKVLFCVRKKECNIELLRYYGLPYKILSKNYKSVTGKIFGYILYEIKLLFVSLKFVPDIFISHGSFYAAHISFILRKKHIALEDTGNMEQVRLYMPFSNAVLTSTSFKKDLGPKQIYYNGYHELAYLHPNQFKPEPEILNLLKLKENEKYAIVRFVSDGASHDISKKILSIDSKRKIVQTLSGYLKVFISSEDKLPDDLEKYELRIDPYDMHHLMYYSSIYIGNSATMASESAIMGVPAIYLDEKGRDYTDEEEKKYALVYNFTLSDEDIIRAIDQAVKIINHSNSKEEYKIRSEQLISENIDVTAFFIWFTLDFPRSIKILKNDPAYQLKFSF